MNSKLEKALEKKRKALAGCVDRIFMVDEKGSLANTFDSVYEVAKKLNRSEGVIYSYLRTGKKFDGNHMLCRESGLIKPEGFISESASKQEQTITA